MNSITRDHPLVTCAVAIAAVADGHGAMRKRSVTIDADLLRLLIREARNAGFNLAAIRDGAAEAAEVQAVAHMRRELQAMGLEDM